MLVELKKMEQRDDAVLAVVRDGLSVGEVAVAFARAIGCAVVHLAVVQSHPEPGPLGGSWSLVTDVAHRKERAGRGGLTLETVVEALRTTARASHPRKVESF